jgi:RNA polymerase sigma-70 factor (ECF subfamily)
VVGHYSGAGAPQVDMAGTSKLIRVVRGNAEASDRPRGDDCHELVRALRAGEPWAERALLRSEAAHVERLLMRILGYRAELDDLVQEVFIRAFARIGTLREPESLRPWLGSIAAFVAREAIRRKRRRRWLVFLPAEECVELPTNSASFEARTALRVFYQVVDAFPADERIAFTLRFVEGMELTEVAEVCQVSLATIKRRLKRASDDFYVRGRARAELVDWFEEGSRWRIES